MACSPSKLKPSLDRVRGLVMKQPVKPFLLPKDQFPEKEDRMGEFMCDVLTDRLDCVDGVGSDTHPVIGAKSLRPRPGDVALEIDSRLLLEPVDLVCALEVTGVDDRGAHEDEILEGGGEEPVIDSTV